jgi:hypothetical protein
MPFTYFDNYVNAGVSVTTNDYYRDLTQAFINQQWDNTSAKTPENGGVLKEQNSIGSSEYSNIEAWLAPIVADTSTGLKYPEDFLKLVFKDIDHSVQRGLMYQYHNEYWIAYSYASFDGLPQSVGIRRCNNVLRMIDPDNGSIFSIPCCVDYDMLAPTPQVSRYIITPNSHAVVMVQGNYDTNRLFKINTRFILGGRPFKLYAYQNTIKYNNSDDISSLWYLDLYLDEIHANDDLENQLAYNGNYDYSIIIYSNTSKLRVGHTGDFNCSVLLNGIEVERDVVWESSDPSYLIVDEDGHYQVRRATGGTLLTITASLVGNNNIKSTRACICVSSGTINGSAWFSPMITQIQQYNSITVRLCAAYDGDLYDENLIIDRLNAYGGISVVNNNDGTITITGNEIGNGVLSVGLSYDGVPSYEVQETRFNIQVVSMMG